MALLPEGFSEYSQLLLDLASLYFIRLGSNNDRLVPCLQDPVVHHHILSGGFMADIQEQKDRPELPAGVQIALDHLSPLFLDPDIGLRIAVTGQIHQVELPVDLIIIDSLRLAGLGTYAGKRFTVHQSVDQGRFSYVASSASKFRQAACGILLVTPQTSARFTDLITIFGFPSTCFHPIVLFQ